MRYQFLQLKMQLGWQGMCGLGLLLLAGAFHILALEPVEQEVAYIHNRLDAFKSKSDQSKSFNSGDRQRELGAFFDSLPAEQDVTDILATISAVGEVSQVGFKQAEYNIDSKDKTHLEYGLYFPMQGGYANVRHFVFRVLADHHAIALDQVNFQRDKVNDSLLKAEIRMTLFLRRQE